MQIPSELDQKRNSIKDGKVDKSNKIYLLKRIFSIGYDEYEAKVIVASSAKAARKLANRKYGDEGPIWNDSGMVLCREITVTSPQIILEAFNAG